MDSPFMASLYQKIYVRVHEWDSHCDRRTIRQDEVWVLPEFLDDTKYSPIYRSSDQRYDHEVRR